MHAFLLIGATTGYVGELKRQLERNKEATGIWKVFGGVSMGVSSTAYSIDLVVLIQGENLDELLTFKDRLGALTSENDVMRKLVDHASICPVFPDSEQEHASLTPPPKHLV